MDGVAGRTVAVWGLTYKPGTVRSPLGGGGTLRASTRRWGDRAGDPALKELPPALAAHVRFADNALDAVTGASALVVATPWPEYRVVAADQAAARMTRRLGLDANRFLGDTFGSNSDFEYLSVGKPGR